MTSDEARDRFGDAIDGTLAGGDRAAFDTALEGDPELREEYELYRKIVGGAAALGERSSQPPPPGTPPDPNGIWDAAPPADFLPKVQARIRQRTRGRFFRDKNAESAAPRGATTTVLVVLTIVVLIAVAVLLHQRFTEIDLPPETPPTTSGEPHS